MPLRLVLLFAACFIETQGAPGRLRDLSSSSIQRDYAPAQTSPSPQERARELAGRKNSKAFKSISHPTTYNHALWHAVLNQKEEALDLLEQAYRDHHSFIINIKAEPFFDSLRDEPGFIELERKLGL